MSFFAAKGGVRPTALQRRKMRRDAEGDDDANLSVGFYRRHKQAYESYTAPKPQQEDTQYLRDVKLRQMKERADELAGDETGGWATAWNFNNDQDLSGLNKDDQNQQQQQQQGGGGDANSPQAANQDPWAAQREAAANQGLSRIPPPEEPEPEIVAEMLIPADETTLDREETAETVRRHTQAKFREARGGTRLSTTGFASPYDQRYGSRPDVMNGTIKCDFVQLRLPRSPNARNSPGRFHDSVH